MNLQKIEQLITRYENGETTTAEEKVLYDFFSQKEIPFHLRSYKAFFQFLEFSQQEKLPDKDFDKKLLSAIKNKKKISRPVRIRKMYRWAGIAASIIILLGIYFQFGIRNPIMNSGVDDLKNIKEFDKNVNELNNLSAFTEGINDLEKIAEFEKSKKIITSK